jgi:hypothetical protein
LLPELAPGLLVPVARLDFLVVIFTAAELIFTAAELIFTAADLIVPSAVS